VKLDEFRKQVRVPASRSFRRLIPPPAVRGRFFQHKMRGGEEGSLGRKGRRKW